MFLKKVNNKVVRWLLVGFLIFVVPLVVAYVLSLPFINANYIINTGELLFALWLLQPSVMAWALSQWWTTYYFMYFQESADYYYLLMGWSMKEVSIIDTWSFWMLLIFLSVIMIICVAASLRRR